MATIPPTSAATKKQRLYTGVFSPTAKADRLLPGKHKKGPEGPFFADQKTFPRGKCSRHSGSPRCCPGGQNSSCHVYDPAFYHPSFCFDSGCGYWTCSFPELSPLHAGCPAGFPIFLHLEHGLSVFIFSSYAVFVYFQGQTPLKSPLHGSIIMTYTHTADTQGGPFYEYSDTASRTCPNRI